MPTKKPARRKPLILASSEPLRLDLGSGPRPAEGFKGVDRVPGVTDFCHNLCDGTRWPWPDNSVSELRSSHMIEHIDAVYLKGIPGYPGEEVDALYWFLDEAFRVAQPNAVFKLQWPALKSSRAFQDPTHRRFIPAEQVMYWCTNGRQQMGEAHFGVKCNWIGDVTPTIPIPTETEEDKVMALRADSSDAKQAWAQKRGLEQQRRYVETWDFSIDLIATLRAVK